MPDAPAGRILIVDDELRMCHSLEALLEREHYDVSIAASGKQALSLLSSDSFDLVLTDIRMPEYNGIDILQRARKIDPNIIVILMTGFASLESAKAAINKGAFDYLTKPLDFDELIRCIKRGLASRYAEREKHHLLELLSSSNKLLEERVNQLNALYKSAGVLSGTTNLDTLLNQIINLVTGVVGASSGSIMLLDKSGKFLKIASAIGIERDIMANTKVPVGEGVSGYVAASRDSVIIDDISSDPRFDGINTDRYETSSAISTPIIHRDDLLGVINLNNKENRQKFSIDDLRLLETFASHAAIAIVNAGLFEENRAKLNELAILHRIAIMLSSSRSESEVFSALFKGMKSIVEADFCYFLSATEDSTILKVSFAEDSNRNNFRLMESSEFELPQETAASQDIADKKKWLEDYLKRIFRENIGENIMAFISVPVSVENSLSGFICVGNYGEEEYSLNEERLISIIASQAASLYERQRGIINGSKLLIMGRMVSELTHDLKKPLTNIRGTLQVMQARLNDMQSSGELLDSALQEVDRLTDLVKEMLDFADPRKYKRAARDVVPMLERALSLLGNDINKAGINVVKDFPQKPYYVLINEAEVFEAFINIMLNAIESMPEGGDLRLGVRKYTANGLGDNYLRVSIGDRGHGIPEEKLNRIFERYYTTKDGGTGLGLALVERVMSSHEGHVGVESNMNMGTTFHLDFPVN